MITAVDGSQSLAQVDRLEAAAASRGKVRGPTKSGQCAAHNCKKIAKENKPFCVDHLERLDRARLLMEELEATEREHNKIKAKGPRAVRMDGPTMSDVVLAIRERGSITMERLCRQTRLEYRLAEAYVQALERRGGVKTTKNARNCTVITWKKDPREKRHEDADDVPTEQ